MKSVQKLVLLSYDTYHRLLEHSKTTPQKGGGQETPKQFQTRPPGLPIEKKRKEQRKKWIHL